MTVEELFLLVRRELDDETQPYNWTDAELMEYLVDAENEAARRARLFLDSTTTAVCQIAITGGTATYSLDPRVIQVLRIRLGTETTPLKPLMMVDLDDCYPAWETDTQDPPLYWCPDYETGKIRLIGVPTNDTTAYLTVNRLPLVDVDQGEDALEVRPEYHRNLRHWMLHRAYSKRDSETNNEELSDKCLLMFEREFGKPRPAYDEQWVTRYYQNVGGRY